MSGVCFNMIGDALARLRSEKEQATLAEGEKASGAAAQKAELDGAREDIEAKLIATIELAEAQQVECAQAASALEEAQEALAAATRAQHVEEEACAALEKECAAVEVTQQQSLGFLKEGTWQEEAEASKHLGAILTITAKLKKLEESLSKALPGTLVKKLGDRASFDELVFQEAEKLLTVEAERLRVLVAEGTSKARERASAVADAQAKVSATEGTVKEKFAVLEATRAQEHEYREARKEAAKAVKDFLPSFTSATKAHDALRAELEAFVHGPLSQFDKLKEHRSSSQEMKQGTDAVAEGTAAELGA